MSLRLGTGGRRDYRPVGLRRVRLVRPVDSRPLAGNDSDDCGNPRPGPESRRPGQCRLQLGAQSRPVPARAMRITRVRLAAVAAPGHVGPAQGPAARPTRTEWPGRFRQRGRHQTHQEIKPQTKRSLANQPCTGRTPILLMHPFRPGVPAQPAAASFIALIFLLSASTHIVLCCSRQAADNLILC